jgi:hypothetical protein
MYQPCPSSGQPAGPLRPPAPAPVRTAVKLMYAGAAVNTRAAARFMQGGAISSAALLIVSLPFAGDVKGDVLGRRLTPNPLTITLVILVGLALIGLWLWMARATSQGKNWARIVSTVLFALATLVLIGSHGPVLAAAALTWLSGLGAVWMLWRPASSAFFKSARDMRSRPPSQISGSRQQPARLHARPTWP